MEPEHLRYGGGSGANADPISIVIMLLMGILILILPKKYVIYPFLFGSFFIPFGQVIVIAGLHWQMLRFIALFGVTRIIGSRYILRSEKYVFREFQPLDKIFIALTFVIVVAFILLFKDSGAVVNQLGEMYNAFTLYFLLRFLMETEEDVKRAFKAFVIIGCVAAVFMLIEQITTRNLFGLLGGVPLITAERDGRLRSQAFFGHSIIAGCYGAILLPLCVWLWLRGRDTRKYAVAGALAGTVITYTSASSTPALAYVAGLLGFAFWPLRKSLRWVRRGIVAVLILLHMIMKGPVWSLIAHVDVIGGNSADHRYQLVNTCINHFWDWWMIGTKDNATWGYDMWDTANAYVAIANNSGLLALILFLALFSRSFRSVGLARAAVEGDRRKALMFWSLGAALFAQAVAFFGIAYYDQTVVFWYALLVAILVTSSEALAPGQPILAPTPAVSLARPVEVNGTAEDEPYSLDTPYPIRTEK